MKKNESPAVILGRLGGEATLRKHGKAHYHKMSKKRWPKKETAKK